MKMSLGLQKALIVSYALFVFFNISAKNIVLSGNSSSSFIQDSLQKQTNLNALLDQSFGSNGTNKINGFIAGGGLLSSGTTIAGGTNDSIQAIAIQSDGKIVVGGFGSTSGGSTRCTFARFNPDGTLDASFGSTGNGTESLIPGTFFIPGPIVPFGGYEAIAALVIQEDGKIVAVGSSNSTFVARFNSNGTLDSSFGQAGDNTAVNLPGTVYFTDSSIAIYVGKTVGLKSGGEIVVAVQFNYNYFGLAQFTTDGALDGTFGVTVGDIVSPYPGVVYINGYLVLSGTRDQPNALFIYPNDTVLVAGGSADNTYNYCSLARFTAAGGLDTTFGVPGGNISQQFAGTEYINHSISVQDNSAITDRIQAITVMEDGTIFAGIITIDNYDNKYFAAAKLGASGALDPSFGQTSMFYGREVSYFGGTVFINGSLCADPFHSGHTNDRVRQIFVLNNGDLVVLVGDSVSAALGYFALAGFTSVGALDPSFGVAVTGQTAIAIPGTVYCNQSLAGGTFQVNYCAALQSNKNIVLGGVSDNVLNVYYFAAAEFTPAGALNDSFGKTAAGTESLTQGTVFINGVFDLSNDTVTTELVQADGKPVIAGYSYDSLGHPHWAFARFTTTGAPDLLFGLDTLYTATLIAGSEYISSFIAGGTSDQLAGIVAQQNGSIIAAGTSQDADGHSHFALARLLLSGALDGSFGLSGAGTTSLFAGSEYLTNFIAGGSSDQVAALALQADGKIVVGGTSADGGGNNHFAVARFLSTGVIDSSFGTNGTTFIDGFIAGGTNDQLCSVLINVDGSLIAVGTSNDAGGNPHFAVAKFTEAGTLDVSFGATSGGVTSSIAGTAYITNFIAGGTNDSATSAALLNDGSFVVGGASQNSGTAPCFAVACFTSDGILAPAFGKTQGNTTSSILGTVYINSGIAGGTSDLLKSLVLQVDGSLLLGGSSADGAGALHFATARLLPTGLLDQTFGATGQDVTSLFSGSSFITTSFFTGGTFNQIAALALQNSGNFVTGGTAQDSSGNAHFALARFFNPFTPSSYQAAYTRVGAGLNC